MATIVERMLRESLATNADYKTTQLLKSGKLAAAAASVVESRRKTLKFITIGFSVTSLLTSASLLVFWITSIARSHHESPSGLNPLLGLVVLGLMLPLIQGFAVMAWRSSLARLEMLVLFWLQEEPELNDLERKSLEDVLSKKTLGVF